MATMKPALRPRSINKAAPIDGSETTGIPAPTAPIKQTMSRSEALKANVDLPGPEDPAPTTTMSVSTAPSQSQLALPLSTNNPSEILAISAAPQSANRIMKPVHSSGAETSDTQQLHILTLPPELVLYMTTFLPFNALLSLRSTCHSLRTLLCPSHISKHRSTITSDLLSTERTQLQEYRLTHSPQPFSHLWDLFYAAFEWQLQERPAKELICYGCLETKPLHSFVERMSSRGTGLGGKLAKHRRCKDCMRRFYSTEGCWWREHWVRKSEHRKRRSRAERVARWITRGDSLVETVEKGEEVGVCACCGGRQSELWWGCAGCFEKEEKRGRRSYSQDSADSDDDEGDDSTGFKSWLLDRGGDWRSRRIIRRRRRETRRAEEGRWWRRIWRSTRRGGVLRWEGSWEGRVEALVELLQGTGTGEYNSAKDNSSYEHLPGRRDTNLDDKNGRQEWKPLDQVPLKKDRREARCSYCWVPRRRNVITILGLAWETDLPFKHWCEDCQKENVERKAKREKNISWDQASFTDRMSPHWKKATF